MIDESLIQYVWLSEMMKKSVLFAFLLIFSI